MTPKVYFEWALGTIFWLIVVYMIGWIIATFLEWFSGFRKWMK